MAFIVLYHEEETTITADVKTGLVRLSLATILAPCNTRHCHYSLSWVMGSQFFDQFDIRYVNKALVVKCNRIFGMPARENTP